MADRTYRNDRPIPRDFRDCYDCQGTNGGHYRECPKYLGADAIRSNTPDASHLIAMATKESYGACETTKDRIGDAKARKAVPLFSGVLKYFPDALIELAELSRIGNDQHNPGKPLHWDRSKSGDELDALARHLVDAGTRDTDNVRHSTKVLWRAAANLQKEIEAEKATPWLTEKDRP